ncbi:MAG: DNA repair protein [Azospira oryzae]|nr:MAG: DNA repair protein [Azospira oryzae]
MKVKSTNNKEQPKTRKDKKTIVFGLGLIPKEGVPGIKIRYNKSKKGFLGVASNSRDCYEFLKRVFDRRTIQLQESFVVIYLDKAHQILGYYKHSIGGITGTVADPRIIFATAIASASSSIILSHNHPSGNLNPSKADLEITQRIKDIGKLLEIQLLDHLIISKNGYYSFADKDLI